MSNHSIFNAENPHKENVANSRKIKIKKISLKICYIRFLNIQSFFIAPFGYINVDKLDVRVSLVPIYFLMKIFKLIKLLGTAATLPRHRNVEKGRRNRGWQIAKTKWKMANKKYIEVASLESDLCNIILKEIGALSCTLLYKQYIEYRGFNARARCFNFIVRFLITFKKTMFSVKRCCLIVSKNVN